MGLRNCPVAEEISGRIREINKLEIHLPIEGKWNEYRNF